MGQYLDLDDVANGNPRAEAQLKSLRARVAELEGALSELIRSVPVLDKAKQALAGCG